MGVWLIRYCVFPFCSGFRIFFSKGNGETKNFEYNLQIDVSKYFIDAPLCVRVESQTVCGLYVGVVEVLGGWVWEL